MRFYLLILVLLSLALRWAFLGQSTIEVWADAQEYWHSTLQIRDSFCQHLPFCQTSGDVPPPSLYDMLLSRSGWLPYLLALTQLTDQPDPQRSYVLFMLMDASIVLMLADSALRLRFSPRIALAVAGIYALYIPAIVSTGALLRHPLERWLVMLMVWAYLRGTRELLFAASILFSLLGFQFRVLVWLMWALFLWPAEQRRFWAWGIAAYALILLGISFAIHPQAPPLSAVFLGYDPTDASLSNHLGSIAAHENFWIPDSAYSPDYYQPSSLTAQIRAHPGRFLERLPRSIYYTWTAPENVYFQRFILSLHGQYVLYQFLLFMGLLGWVWLLFRRAEFGHLWLILGMMIALTTLISASLSVEQRRIAMFMPVLLLGVGGALEAPWPRKLVQAWILTAAMWVLSFRQIELWWQYESFKILLLLASLLVLLQVWQIRQRWQQGAVLGAGLLLGLGGLSARYHEPLEWSVYAKGSLTQEVSHFEGEDHLLPWVLLDIRPRQPLGQDLALYANDQLIKPMGQALYIWQITRDYTPVPSSTLENSIAQQSPRRWFAFPLPADFRHAENIVLRLEMEGSVLVYGDVMTTKPLILPAFSPFSSGFSVFRWLWNGSDLRLGQNPDLNGDYSESYRIYVVNQPFGGQNNALRVPDDYYLFRPNEGECPQGRNLLPVMARLRLCESAEGKLLFYSHEGALIQTLDPLLPESPHQLLAQIPLESAYMDLIYAELNQYVLNFWSESGQLLDSVTFSLDYPYQKGQFSHER